MPRALLRTQKSDSPNPVQMTRRNLLGLSLGAGALFALEACGSGSTATVCPPSSASALSNSARSRSLTPLPRCCCSSGVTFSPATNRSAVPSARTSA